MKPRDGQQTEILIIRRNNGDDGMAHKGGAWKIAYADFVTAMMAFFLVMWLINSANEVTKARVASYFNPIKMTDAAPTKRGLKETTDAQSPNIQAQPVEDSTKRGGAANSEKSKDPAELSMSEEALLLNPYAALDELVKRADSGKLSGSSQDQSVVSGDPFNPHAFENLKEMSKTEVRPEALGKKVASSGVTEGDQATKKAPEETVASAVATEKASKLDDSKAAAPGKSSDGSTAEDRRLAKELQDRISSEIEGARDKIDINVTVQSTPEGLLIALEDGKSKSMFAVGSAEPNPALIEIVGSIGQLLAKTDRGVVIRGHTDGRLFRNRKYDNWQLSTDRAHMASYMLIRGGLPESRVSRIEGYGSSKPLEKDNFLLDENRRVEFLIIK